LLCLHRAALAPRARPYFFFAAAPPPLCAMPGASGFVTSTPLPAVAAVSHSNFSAFSSKVQPLAPAHALNIVNCELLQARSDFLSMLHACSPSSSHGSLSWATESSHKNSIFFSAGSSTTRQPFAPRQLLSFFILLSTHLRASVLSVEHA